MSSDDDRYDPVPPPAPNRALEKRRIITTRGRSRSGEMMRLEAWIQTARIDTDKDGPCTAFALVHKPSDKELHFVQLGGSPGRSDEELARVFLQVAQGYADGMSGVQSFEMLAFYGSSGDRPNEPQAYQPFQLTGKTEFEGGATEAPDERGMKAQGMRHLESAMGLAFRNIETMHRASHELMRDMGIENRELRTENRSMFALMKELLVEREKLSHDYQMKQLEYSRSSEERAMWLKMAPPLVNSVMGKDVFPVSTADTALIEAAVEHLTPEKLQMLSAVLPPAVWGPLATRMQEILEEKEKGRMRSQELARLASPIAEDDPQAGEK